MAKSKSSSPKGHSPVKWQTRVHKSLKTYAAEFKQASDAELLAGQIALWEKLLLEVTQEEVPDKWNTIYFNYWPQSGVVSAHVGQRRSDLVQLPNSSDFGVMVRVTYDALIDEYDQLPDEVDESKAFDRAHEALEKRVWKAVSAAAKQKHILSQLKQISGERPLAIWTFCADDDEGAQALKVPGLKTSKLELNDQKQAIAALDELRPYSHSKLFNFDESENVQSIKLSGAKKITDADLAHLTQLKTARKLFLFNTPITDLGLEHVAQLSELRTLDLSMTGITDKGLESVSNLDQLVVLDLGSCQLNGSGLKHLTKLPSLRLLQLRHTAVTDKSLTAVAKLPALRALGLGKAKQVTENCLELFAKQANLRQLDLFGMRLTSQGIVHLKTMTFLEELGIGETEISDDLQAELQAALEHTTLSAKQLQLRPGKA